MKSPALAFRDDLTKRTVENWQPPVFRPPRSTWLKAIAALRRCADLQASSIWHDLKILLAGCEGAVLDVGCGAQPYRSLLPEGLQYTGIDTADAGRDFGYHITDGIYFHGTRWPVATGNFDTVFATETLEHVESPEEFLSEARRVLKPNGFLILTIPFAARWHYIPHDYWRFTPSGLRKILVQAGFEVPVVYARGNEITVACYKVMALILMLLLGKQKSMLVTMMLQLAGCFLLPLLILLAAVGQLSLRGRGGNDCLGYTVVASLPISRGVHHD